MTRVTILVIVVSVLLASLISAESWLHTDWSGGPGQLSWSDTTMFYEGGYVDWLTSPGDLLLEFPVWTYGSFPFTTPTYTLLLQPADSTIYAGGSWGDIFRYFPQYQMWQLIWSLPGDVRTLLRANGALYAGCSGSNEIFMSIDAGSSWVVVGMLPPHVTNVWSLLKNNGTFIAGTGSSADGEIYRSTDGGQNWEPVFWLPDGDVFCLIQAQDSILYAGVSWYDGSQKGDVYRSTDGGSLWEPTGELPTAWSVYSLLQATDGALYAGTYPFGDVFKSIDVGTTWVNTVNLEGATGVHSLIQSTDGPIYAGSSFYGDIFESTDNGTSWYKTSYSDSWSKPNCVNALIQTMDGTLFAGTDIANSAEGIIWGVYGSPYSYDNYLTSSIYDAYENEDFGIMMWDYAANGCDVEMRVRTDTLLDMSTAMDWDSCAWLVNGEDISNVNSVTDGERYIQYRAYLRNQHPFNTTPVLHYVSLQYITGVKEEKPTYSSETSSFSLNQNSPNPFRTSTTITFTRPRVSEHQNTRISENIELKIYDLSGRLVKDFSLGTRHWALGTEVTWDGRDDNNKKLSAGTYFYELKAGKFKETKKMTVVR